MRAAEKIMALAEAKGLKQIQLARAAAVDPARVSDWKSGKGNPSLEQAYRLARLLGVTIDYLADDDQNEPREPEALSFEEKLAVSLVRAKRLGEKEIVDRLTSEPPADKIPPFVNPLRPGDPLKPPKAAQVG